LIDEVPYTGGLTRQQRVRPLLAAYGYTLLWQKLELYIIMKNI